MLITFYFKVILFLSDLHLSFDKPQITRHFIHFLQTKARHAKAVYILGDLFDAWVGDDDFTRPNAQIRHELKELTDSGVEVYLQRGNRDFLIGERFSNETGVILLEDYAVIDLKGQRTGKDAAAQGIRGCSSSPIASTTRHGEERRCSC